MQGGGMQIPRPRSNQCPAIPTVYPTGRRFAWAAAQVFSTQWIAGVGQRAESSPPAIARRASQPERLCTCRDTAGRTGKSDPVPVAQLGWGGPPAPEARAEARQFHWVGIRDSDMEAAGTTCVRGLTSDNPCCGRRLWRGLTCDGQPTSVAFYYLRSTRALTEEHLRIVGGGNELLPRSGDRSYRTAADDHP